MLRSELGYTHEGRALDRFRAAFEDTPAVVFPTVYWDHTTSRVLTMDFVEGVPATRLESEDVAGVDRAGVVDTGVSCYMRQIFEFGYFHADPHAGNIFALGEGRTRSSTSVASPPSPSATATQPSTCCSPCSTTTLRRRLRPCWP